MPCPDSDCGRMAEPEADGDLRYWACACGIEFGFSQVRSEPDCQLGIPEDVRLRGTVTGRLQLQRPVFVEISRRPDVLA